MIAALIDIRHISGFRFRWKRQNKLPIYGIVRAYANTSWI